MVTSDILTIYVEIFTNIFLLKIILFPIFALNNYQLIFNMNMDNNANCSLKPTIELEQQIGQQIYNALQGPIVEEVLRKCKKTSSDVYWRSNMEGNCLKVEKSLLPDFYALCQEVKQRLNIEENVDFYITGNSEINAFSVSAEDENEPHIVNINSGLFDLMTNDELKFVIGHELGHLINKDSALARLINFVFPPNANIPMSLQYKVRLHEQLAELVADRYGYLATGDLGVCVSAFFKMASGLDIAKLNVSIEALIEDNNSRLDYFLNDKGLSRASHPVNPVRIQALNLFANATSEQELDQGMEELFNILMKLDNSEMGENIARFMASAGLIVANCDGEVTYEEIKGIIENLSSRKIFPQKFLDEIAEGDVNQIFMESVENILNENPGMRDCMLQYMINIVLADNNIKKEELDLLYNFGRNIGLSEIEISREIANQIQCNFVPSIEALS